MDNKQSELYQKRKEYIKYIDEHRTLVKDAFLKFKKSNIGDLTNEDIELLSIEIENHDLSKYESEEFEAYRRHFFPCSFESPKDSQKDFEAAVEHHYSVNNHHPQNLSRQNGLNKVASIHNILDWVAMSYKFKDDVWRFYEESSIREKINAEERCFIENILKEMKRKKYIFYPSEIEV